MSYDRKLYCLFIPSPLLRFTENDLSLPGIPYLACMSYQSSICCYKQRLDSELKSVIIMSLLYLNKLSPIQSIAKNICTFFNN